LISSAAMRPCPPLAMSAILMFGRRSLEARFDPLG
jgi:hypothetical protein